LLSIACRLHQPFFTVWVRLNAVVFFSACLIGDLLLGGILKIGHASRNQPGSASRTVAVDDTALTLDRTHSFSSTSSFFPHTHPHL
jgi:hypothetical protein